MNIFGSPFALCVDAGNKNCVTADGSRLHLTVTDRCDSELKKKVLRTYLESVCRNVVENMCHDFHKAYFEPLGISFPALKFRLMKSRGGSCQPQNGVLTFNYALLNVPDDCVFYVVAHEFTISFIRIIRKGFTHSLKNMSSGLEGKTREDEVLLNVTFVMQMQK